MGIKDAFESAKSDSSLSIEDSEEEIECCPECGKEGEKSDYYYWRCTSSSSECRVMTFFPTDYEVDADKFID